MSSIQEKAKFQYWNGSNWITVNLDGTTGSNGEAAGWSSAIISLNIMHRINHPVKATVSLINRSTTPTDVDIADAKGNLTGIFTALMECRILTGMGIVLFRGRVYLRRERYDTSYGSIIELQLFDALKELAEFPLKTSRQTYTSATGEGRSDTIIKATSGLLAQVGTDNLAFANTGSSTTSRFEKSIVRWPDTVARRDWNKGARSAISHLEELSRGEPLGDGNFAFDYYVDSNTTTAAASTKPVPFLHYFPRGTRPNTGTLDAGYATAIADRLANPASYGLSIEFPDSGWDTETGQLASMMVGYDFDEPNDERYTSVILRTEESSIPVNIEFERIDGTTAGAVTSYKDRAIRFETRLGTTITTAEGVVHAAGTLPMKIPYATTPAIADELPSGEEWSDDDVDNEQVAQVLALLPEDLYNSSGARCAELQYQSGVGANQYYIVSNIDAVGDNFPTGDSSATIGNAAWKAASFNAGAAGAKTIVFTPSAGRPKEALNINRPAFVVRPSLLEVNNAETLRGEVVSTLSFITEAPTRMKLSTPRQPYHYIDAVAADVGISANVVTFTASDTFPNNTKDARLFGVREGMVIAEMDSDAPNTVTRYSYISLVGTGGYTITYGSSATDTSDGTALDPTKNIRIYIPLHAGDTIYIKNHLANFAGTALVTNIDYTEAPGVRGMMLSAAGVNSSPGARRTGIEFSSASSLNEGVRETLNLGPAVESFVTFSSTDYRTIAWTVGVIVAGPDAYQLAAGNTGNMIAGTQYVIYLRPSVSTTVIQSTPMTLYHAESDDVILGYGRADADTAGKATFDLLPDVAGTSGSVASFDVTRIANNRMTGALLKKGAQPFATSVEFLPSEADGTVTSANHANAVYNAVRWIAGNISFGQSATDDTAISAGYAASLAAGTHYIYYTIGGSTLSTTTDFKVPFDDGKVLLATVVVAASDPGAGHSPTILPINGKQLTISAVNMTANTILADHITAGTITAAKLESDLVIANTFKTPAGVASGSGSSQQGLKLSSAGLEGYNGAGSRVFFLDPASGTVTVGGGADGDDGSNGSDGDDGDDGDDGEDGSINFTNAKATIPAHNNSGSNTPAVNSKQYDTWVTSDTSEMYVALHATTNDAIASGKWTRKDDATAINQASTTIKGGLINTRRIVLTSGGSSDFLATGDQGSSGTRIEIGHDGIRGYGPEGGAGTEQFKIDPADGKAKFGGLTNAILSSEGIQLGDATFADAEFSVTPAGVLKATSATITGEITATSGSFTGTLAAAATGAADSNRILINSTGLHIQAASAGNSRLNFENAAGDAKGGIYYIASGETLLVNSSAGQLDLQAATNNDINLSNSGSGEVVITQDLAVLGDITYVGSISDVSDSRKKTNIADFTGSDALALISSLQPRTFNKLDDDGDAIDILRYGLVAQEVEAVLTGLSIDKTKSGFIVLPDTDTIERIVAGTTTTRLNPRRLSYAEFIAPLIGAVKELKARVEVLEGS